jgi:two-component system LytT family response regulator
VIRTVIVDDEPLARQGLRLRLEREKDIDIAGEAADGPSAVDVIRRTSPDLVFLDIQMPGMTGFDVLAEIADLPLPVIIFVTAHDEFAVRAFEVDAIDYLLKPFTHERFEQALRRARRDLSESEPLARIAVRSRDAWVILKVDEIDWLEAAGNYVEVHARGKSYLLRSTISSLEERLDRRRFSRIHRGAIVNVDRVAQIRSDAHGDFDVTLHDGNVLRMSRKYAKALLPSPFTVNR